MQGWKQDFSYAFRKLGRTPGLLAAAVVSIGLGIAANTTIFSIVSTMVFQRAPVSEPDRLITIHTMHRGDCCSEFSWLLYRDVAEQTSSFTGVAARFPLLSAAIAAAGEPQLHWGQLVTPNFFRVNGVPMSLGRGFQDEEDKLNVVVLSESLWRSRLGADTGIVGKKISLAGMPYTVVGVTGRGFRGMDLALQSEYWVPLGLAAQVMKSVPDRNSPTTTWLSVTGRLKPGISRQQAEAELAVLAGRLSRQYTDAHGGLSFQTGDAGMLLPGVKSQVLMFLGALSVVVLLVLLIACTNVANLLLAQATARRKEIAVRLALGASRWQIVRQMLAESLLIALAVGLLGVLISIWTTQALSAFRLPLPLPIAVNLQLDWRVLAYTMLLSVGSGLLFGMAPAFAASRVILTGALKGEDAFTGANRRWNVRNALVFAQVAMSMLLLCATGLFLRSLAAAHSIQVGFRGHGLTMMAVDPPASGYSRERTVAFLQELETRIGRLPGVESVGLTDMLPLSIGGSTSTLRVEGRAEHSKGDRQSDFFLVSPGYFRTMDIPLVAGRVFAGETSPQKLIVVNETFVKRFFDGSNPLGRRVLKGEDNFEIIGVVKDTKSRTLGEDPRSMLYRQLTQDLTRDAGFLGFTIIVRGPSAGLTSAIRTEIRAMDAALPVFKVETMEEHLRDALFLPRLAGLLFGVFGFVGLLLASVGLYGVMSYSVSRRTREIGIRMALGAGAGGVRAMIVRQGMLLSAAAMAMGLAAALAVAKLAAGVLYGIHPHDPLTFALVIACLAAVALLACWIPARRASRVEPLRALRYE